LAKSSRHHWWPVGLQSYWATLGIVKWITHTGETDSKKYENENIAKKLRGHTIVIDPTYWRENFEDSFGRADDSIHRVAKSCIRLFSLTMFGKLVWRAAKTRIKRKTGIEDFAEHFKIDPILRRDLINLCLSLLIRSPRNRFQLERVGASFGLPANEEVGKMNMKIQVDGLARHYNDSFRGNVFPLIIYSQVAEFVFGDGLLDGISSSIGQGILRGHALVPLTPHICIFLATPHSIRHDRDARILYAQSWLVDEINSITQVYSKSQLFYASKKPKLSEFFSRNEHMSYSGHVNNTVRTLLDLCGERKQTRIFF
jgi:hypothetical protein